MASSKSRQPTAKPKSAGTVQQVEEKEAKRNKPRRQKAKVFDKEDMASIAKNKEKEANSIQDEIDLHLIGIFRMSASAFDFQWKGADTSDQRRVSQDHVKKILDAFAETGLKRCLNEHHISCIVSRAVFEDARQATIKNVGIDPLTTKPTNEDESKEPDPGDATSRYPYLIMPAGITVEAQSGQHRIHALRELFSEERDRWWVVKLYDEKISAQAKEKLRSNASELQLVPTLAEIWANLLLFKERNDNASTNALLNNMGSKGKIKQLLNSEKLCPVFTRALKNRGVWSGFSGGRLSRMMPLRCHEELVQYITRVCQIWESIGEGIVGFWEQIDDLTVKALDGKSPGRFVEDAEFVVEQMSLRLFYKITDTVSRNLILERLLRIDYRIISLNTFWEDIKLVEVFSRIMTDIAFWFSPDFASSKASYRQIFYNIAFNPKAVYPVEDKYPQFKLVLNKLQPIRGPRLQDRSYRVTAYYQVWLFIMRNFFALYKIYVRKDVPGLEIESWASRNVAISVDMTPEDIALYNKRFSIPEWRKLYKVCRALGFYPQHAESLGIGPSFSGMVSGPASTPAAMARDFDKRKIEQALLSCRPEMPEKTVLQMVTDIQTSLPARTAEEMAMFSEVCPRTDVPLARFGGVGNVWLPEFQDCYMKIDWNHVFYATEIREPGKAAQAIKIAEDAELTSVSWFVKRDIIWAFLKPFKSAEPIFEVRDGPWPPPPIDEANAAELMAQEEESNILDAIDEAGDIFARSDSNAATVPVGGHDNSADNTEDSELSEAVDNDSDDDDSLGIEINDPENHDERDVVRDNNNSESELLEDNGSDVGPSRSKNPTEPTVVEPIEGELDVALASHPGYEAEDERGNCWSEDSTYSTRLHQDLVVLPLPPNFPHDEKPNNSELQLPISPVPMTKKNPAPPSPESVMLANPPADATLPDIMIPIARSASKKKPRAKVRSDPVPTLPKPRSRRVAPGSAKGTVTSPDGISGDIEQLVEHDVDLVPPIQPSPTLPKPRSRRVASGSAKGTVTSPDGDIEQLVEDDIDPVPPVRPGPKIHSRKSNKAVNKPSTKVTARGGKRKDASPLASEAKKRRIPKGVITPKSTLYEKPNPGSTEAIKSAVSAGVMNDSDDSDIFTT